MKTNRLQTRRAFALPMTILAVVSLLILIIGLMAMVTLERKTARSYSDATRAEMALESGLADAIATISEVALRDDSLVFRIDDPTTPLTSPTATHPTGRAQFFTFGSVFESGEWRNIPFYSGAQETSTPAPSTSNTPHVPEVLELTQAITNATSKEELKEIGRSDKDDYSVPRGKWVDVPQIKSEYKIRYSWWVEDLAGRIDGRTMGIEDRDDGRSTEELGVFTIFDPSKNTDGSGPEDTLVSKRNTLKTSKSIRLDLSETDAAKIQPYLYYSQKPSTPPRFQPRVIPQGFGYDDAGLPAMELNAAVATADVAGISDHINNNLPNFIQRQGGFPAGESYLNTLAASIIDYADADSNATVGPGYRGVDSYPFVNELYDRYEWVSTTGGVVRIRVSTYVELWNPSQQAIQGMVTFTNENSHQITIPPSGVRTFSTVTYPDATNPLLNTPLSIPANGYRVIAAGSKNYDFTVGAFAPALLEFTTTMTSNFSLAWNGIEVDRARGKLQRTNGVLRAGSSERKWKGNSSPALDISIGQSGDPRSSIYINTWVFANTYSTNTSWGGRNKKNGITNSNYNDMKISNWADKGEDTTAGTPAGDDGVLPTSLAFPTSQPNSTPAYISNSGSYYSLGELGNIFDPSQWTNIQTTSSVANSNSGGGYTLAIGRPEFPLFDKEGQRSAQLIDLFDIDPGNANIPESPRININTAPREVLRTIIAGVTLEDDPAQNSFYPAKASSVGDIFADAIINTRNKAPLRGLSDLNLVRIAPSTPRNYSNPAASPDAEPVFGSIVAYKSGGPAASWDDAGREELFRKVVNLVTFQGKTFRIVVAGEALDNQGKILGRRAKEIHVEIRPARDSSGALIAGSPPTLHKLYEKSL